MFVAEPHSDRRNQEQPQVNFLKKVSIDLGIVLTLVVIVLIIHLHMPPFKRGFFCGDLSIRYPRKPQTVSVLSLYLISLGFPLIFLSMGEILFASQEDYEGDIHHHVFQWLVPKAFVRTYDILISFIFGFLVCVLIVGLSHRMLGVMRPNFIATCIPSLECPDSTSLRYNEDYYCKNAAEDSYIRMSFPSKHATFCFYTMVYLAVYLQNKVRWEYFSVFSNCMQVSLIIVALVVSITRMTDYYSHVSDVCAGIIIGSLVAWFNVCAVYNFFIHGVRMQTIQML